MEPSKVLLVKANTLQADLPLDPFDAIHLSVSIGLSPITLLSRDREFIHISRQFIKGMTPEEFLDTL